MPKVAIGTPTENTQKLAWFCFHKMSSPSVFHSGRPHPYSTCCLQTVSTQTSITVCRVTTDTHQETFSRAELAYSSASFQPQLNTSPPNPTPHQGQLEKMPPCTSRKETALSQPPRAVCVVSLDSRGQLQRIRQTITALTQGTFRWASGAAPCQRQLFNTSFNTSQQYQCS